MQTKLDVANITLHKTLLRVNSGINKDKTGVAINVDQNKELITVDLEGVVGLRVYTYSILEIRP